MSGSSKYPRDSDRRPRLDLPCRLLSLQHSPVQSQVPSCRVRDPRRYQLCHSTLSNRPRDRREEDQAPEQSQTHARTHSTPPEMIGQAGHGIPPRDRGHPEALPPSRGYLKSQAIVPAHRRTMSGQGQPRRRPGRVSGAGEESREDTRISVETAVFMAMSQSMKVVGAGLSQGPEHPDRGSRPR
jgi:hypothetical protein